MKPTQQLHDLGQSLFWLDNITRGPLTSAAALVSMQSSSSFHDVTKESAPFALKVGGELFIVDSGFGERGDYGFDIAAIDR